MDDDLKHDPLDQNQDENVLMEEMIEQETGTAEVRAAEDSAMNSDNETAMEATEATSVEGATSEELEAEMALVDDAVERKHKNRESTSEKAKKSTRQSTSEKAILSQEEKKRQLDPLRLRGKKYRAVVAEIDKSKVYPIEEALELVKKTSTSTFDSAVEMHIKVKGEAVRGTVVLPSGSGKSKKVAVANDETIEAIAAGKLDFDVLLATPAQMPKLAKHAKLLGPKGLMPSPKAGTVTDDIEKATQEISGGRIEYRADKTGVVHVSIGRVSFTVEQLVLNFQAIEQALANNKMQSASLASTMGPGVKVALTK
jgi:large subunit ribosomal protein L1